MNMYHLNIIPIIGEMLSIHYFHKRMVPTYDNHPMFIFSPACYYETYENIVPNNKDWKYHLSKLSISKHGDFLFKNHSNFQYYSFLKNFNRHREAEDIYSELPWSYKKLI